MGRGLRAAITTCAVLGTAAGLPGAQAGTPTLLCQRDEVLRIVDRTVRRWNIYNRIVDGSAVETPTAVSNAVICHVTMTSVAYELTPGGWLPRHLKELRRFNVQVVGNRLFVQVPL
ncbi:hypothetical protein ACFQX4_25250 [Roseomonas sp. GCM10028921]